MLHPANTSAPVCCIFRYGLKPHSAVGPFQPSWIILSTSLTHQTMQHSPAPLRPPCRPLSLVPLSCDPRDLCSVTAQREDPVRRLPWQWPWRASVSQSATHARTHTHSLAYTLRQGRRSIFYYTEGSVGGVGGAMRVALQWAHCRHTGEIRERLSVFLSQWQKVCVCVCLRERRRLLFVIGPLSRKLFGSFTHEDVLNAHYRAAKRPFRRALMSHSTVHNSLDFWSMWAIRASFKIDDPCGI